MKLQIWWISVVCVCWIVKFVYATSIAPTVNPSASPTNQPTTSTSKPSVSPTVQPTTSPTSAPTASPTLPIPQNVLIIIVDDLKGALPSFGDTSASTPNMDNIATYGMRFLNSQVQVSDCAPSRIAFFTGRRPDQTLTFGRQPYFRVKNPELQMMPAYFRSLGYTSVALGKVYDTSSFLRSKNYHYLVVDECPSTAPIAATSCSWDINIPPGIEAYNTNICPVDSGEFPPITNPNILFPVYGENMENDNNESQFFDSCTADQAIAQIQYYEQHPDEPFFLSVGVLRPHLPWAAPAQFWDLYPAAEQTSFDATIYAKDISNVDFFVKQSNKASERLGWSEWKSWTASGNTAPIGIRPRGYYASVAFADSTVGRVFNAVQNSKSQQLRENTLIIVWGDNGMHTGKVLYGKKTIFEAANRVPLIVIPSTTWTKAQTQPIVGTGQGIDFPTESIDVYPTILELCGLPANPTLAGTSLVPYFFNLTRPLKLAAISQYQDHRKGYSKISMAYAVRTKNFRLIQYFTFDPMCWGSTDNCVYYDSLVKRVRPQLYYYPYPGAFETINVYDDPAYAAERAELEAIMEMKSPSWSGLNIQY
jgi:iduronate 2-sulfatase